MVLARVAATARLPSVSTVPRLSRKSDDCALPPCSLLHGLATSAAAAMVGALSGSSSSTAHVRLAWQQPRRTAFIRPHVNAFTAYHMQPKPDVTAEEWAAIYPAPRQPLLVDFGCHSGRFLRSLSTSEAGQATPWNYLGLDIREEYISRAIAKAQAIAATKSRLSYRVCNTHAHLQSTLGQYPGPVAMVSFLFSDPQFKQRHRKRRMINPLFIKELVQLHRLRLHSEAQLIAQGSEHSSSQISEGGDRPLTQQKKTSTPLLILFKSDLPLVGEDLLEALAAPECAQVAQFHSVDLVPLIEHGLAQRAAAGQHPLAQFPDSPSSTSINTNPRYEFIDLNGWMDMAKINGISFDPNAVNSIGHTVSPREAIPKHMWPVLSEAVTTWSEREICTRSANQPVYARLLQLRQ
ncbi:hypothetical protein CAOG_01728 [Capsaspora owczarzaki ATCC 30864]|uniref:tRNA (guanine(46)-N(7))-methyltransferase n=1 Tax=Capsaspora owczarzaki (strain ATCC 30864) TaxID=595528 RepID=A0A0D2WKZ4_CAPO3|nr:hypothetical protein CAOG_01728 [Capsaspora owczarzaki ATCC 30864]KJE90413.1 hypothetical protein CAOG_001728 [Capsaspora owczarzaki ATCC 30864]|eukprot:XP_004364596.1 hypothetical protein CAOG_01728 [Capsaspora owczarzaki ATCC 30864]